MARFRRLTGTAVSAVALAVAAGTALPAVALGEAAQSRPPGPTIFGSQARPAGAARPAWRLALGTHYGPAANASGYSAIVIAGRRVWAFGGTNPGGPSSPVAAFLHGKSWRRSRLPAGLTGFLSAAAPAGREVWAMSGYGRYVLRWDGRRWRVARTWSGPGTLSGLAVASTRDVWVFGTSVDGVRTVGTWHFNGRSWAPVRGVGRDIFRASAVTRRDIWAIAADAHSDWIVHFNGFHWRRMPTPAAVRGIRWHDILALRAGGAWLAGDTGTGQLVFAHLGGDQWSVISIRVRAWAGELAAGDHGSVLATATTSELLATGLVIELTSHGRASWSAIASGFGSGVSDIAFAGWSRSFWASGGYLTRLGGNAAVWVKAGRLPLHRPRSLPDRI